MKSFFMIFLTVLMSVSFTACGGGDSDNSSISMSSDGNRTTLGDATKQDVVLSPVGPFTTAGDFGTIKLDRDYPTAFEDALFLDIRNQWERDYLGYPKGSIGGIVYQYREHAGNGREISENKYKKRYIYPDFVQKVKDKVAGDINKKIILICASGSRTGAKGDKTKDSAAKLLSTNGFTNVYHVDGGFGAWDDEGLPVVEAIK